MGGVKPYYFSLSVLSVPSFVFFPPKKFFLPCRRSRRVLYLTRFFLSFFFLSLPCRRSRRVLYLTRFFLSFFLYPAGAAAGYCILLVSFFLSSFFTLPAQPQGTVSDSFLSFFLSSFFLSFLYRRIHMRLYSVFLWFFFLLLLSTIKPNVPSSCFDRFQ